MCMHICVCMSLWILKEARKGYQILRSWRYSCKQTHVGPRTELRSSEERHMLVTPSVPPSTPPTFLFTSITQCVCGNSQLLL